MRLADDNEAVVADVADIGRVDVSVVGLTLVAGVGRVADVSVVGLILVAGVVG